MSGCALGLSEEGRSAMFLYSFIFAISCIIYMGLAIFVLTQNPRSQAARLVAATIVCFEIWGLQDVVRFNPATPKYLARMAVDFGAFGWCFFASFGLWFAMAFTERQYPRWLVHPLLVVVPLFLVYQQWSGRLVVDFYREPFGWTGVWAPSIWTDLYDIFIIVLSFVSLHLVYRFGKQTQGAMRERQVNIFVAGGAVALTAGFMVNRGLPRLGIYSVPQVASLAGLLWGTGLAYAVARYRMLTISPATAAENILSTISDTLLLVDPRGIIVQANEAALETLGYDRRELVGQPLDTILVAPLSDRSWTESLLESARTESGLRLRRRNGEALSVLLSMSALLDDTGRVTGSVIVAKDVTELERLMEAERKQRLLAEALRDTAGALAGTLDFEEVLQRILSNVVRVVSHETANVMVVEGGVARVWRQHGYLERGLDEWMEHLALSVDEIPTLRLMTETARALRIVDTHSHPDWVDLPESAWIRSYLAAPIVLDGEVIGFLNIESPVPGHFGEEDVERLQAFADQAAIAIRNARLYTQVQEYAAEMEQRVIERTALLQANEARVVRLSEGFLEFGPNAMENIDYLARLCGELLGADCALYNRLSEGMLCSWGQWMVPEGYNPVDDPEGHICYDVIRQGADHPVVYRNLLESDYARTDPNVLPYQLQSYVGMPVKFQDSYVGSLCVVYQSDFVPTEIETRLMEIVASAIGVEEGRKHAEDELREHRNHLEELVAERTARLSAALQEKEVMLKEIHHRVKNNLQIVSSLLSLQSSYGTDERVDEILAESQNRVYSMALVHQRLYQSTDLARIDAGEYILGLAHQLFSTYAVDRGRVVLEVDVADIDLNVDTAIPCGLIVNELISNALKHAFPAGRQGIVCVSMRPVGAGRLELAVRDDGVGLAQDIDLARTGTLGLSLVTMLAGQLGSAVEVDTAGGTAFRFEFAEEGVSQ